MSALEQEHTASSARMDTVGGIYRADPTSHSVNDDDAVRFVTDAYGRQYVVDVGGATDDAAAPSVGTMVMGKFGASTPDANDAAPIRCGSSGEVVIADLNTATDDAAAPTVGPLVMGKFGASSPDANDAAPLRCGATGEIVNAPLNDATDGAAAPTIGPLAMASYVAAGHAAVNDGDAVPLQATSTGVLLVQDQGLATDDAAAPTTGPLVMAKFGASSPDANDATPVRCDATGKLLVAQDTAGAFAVDAGPYSYSHLAASGQVKGGAGFLHSLCFNTPATASVLTIYDNVGAAGNVIGIVTLDVGNLQPFNYVLDVTCATGIYINMTVAVDVTATYR